MTLYAMVRTTLAKYPHTRNDDLRLTLNIWRDFYPGSMVEDEGGWFVSVASMLNGLPREDAIKRVRAKIQNEESLFLPTDVGVLAHRKRFHKNRMSFDSFIERTQS